MKRLALVLLICIAIAAAACSRPTDGAGLFKAEGCVKCHVYKGNGIGIIDLTDVTKRRSDDWIRDQITRPKVNDPGSGMPSFGHLSGSEVDALIGYLHGK